MEAGGKFNTRCGERGHGAGEIEGDTEVRSKMETGDPTVMTPKGMTYFVFLKSFKGNITEY